MPIATRSAGVTWDGSLARGSGVLSSGSHALHAKATALCPVSNALRGNVEISIDAALESYTADVYR